MVDEKRIRLIKLVKKQLSQSTEKIDLETANLDDEALIRGCFSSLSRSSKPSQGFRLTGWGVSIFSKLF